MKINDNTMDLGSVAVDCFFIISGFLITGSYENCHSLKDYLLKRVLRIVPGFVVAFILSVLLFGPLGSIKNISIFDGISNYFSHVGVKNFIVKLSTLQAPKVGAGFEDTPLPKLINEPLWTIQFEFICYLLLPAIAFTKVLKTKWVALILFSVAFIILLLQKLGNFFPYNSYYKASLLGDPYYLPRFLTYYLAGVCFYLYKNYIPRNYLIIIFSASVILYASFQGKLLYVVMPLTISYLLFYLAFNPFLNFSKFASRGDFSYGVYLYAWPVQQLVIYYFSDYIRPLSLFIIASFITLGLAFLSWHFVEKKFLELKNKYAAAGLSARAW